MEENKRDKKKIIINELYNKKKKGFNFYVQDYNNNSVETVKYFLSDKDFNKRNLNVVQLMDYIVDCVYRYGLQDGLNMVDSYYKLD